MRYDSSFYEDEFLDSDEQPFEKISRKGKATKHNKNDSIRKQRKAKEKQRAQELYEYDREVSEY